MAVTVLLINGVNLMDGLDMLAGGTVAVAAVGFAVLLVATGRQVGRSAWPPPWSASCVFNRPPARIYLGDGGVLPARHRPRRARSPAPGPRGAAPPVGVAAFALVALPAAEVAFAVVRRLRGRRSVLAGDRGPPLRPAGRTGLAPPLGQRRLHRRPGRS